MKEYIFIRLKRLSMIFLIPLIVELLVFGYIKLSKKATQILEFHGLWYLAATAIICFITVYLILQDYYVGHDSLWQVMPYSKELLAFIDIVFYIAGTIIFGIVYQSIQNMAVKHTFPANIYVPEKVLSLLTFYFLIVAMCILFKNVQNAIWGRLLIVAASLAVIICEISLFWNMNHGIIKSFMSGISNAGSVKNLVYINVLPYIFFDVSKVQLAQLAHTSFMLNGAIVLISFLFILFSMKFRRLNYIDLVG